MWLQTAAIGTLVLASLFAGYELVERSWGRGRYPAESLFALHLYRGIGASVLVGTVSVLSIWRSRRSYDAAFAAAYREALATMKEHSRALEQTRAFTERLAALGVLSAGIAHDIANPLASISSELEMIEGETELARVRESVAVLRGQVRRIDRTLREMTDFARRRSEEASAVPLDVAVDDALRLVRHDPRARRVKFVVEVDRDLPPLQMVEDHLVMVIVNLVINAFDAMPEGGTLALRTRRDGDGITLAIADTGAGMSEEVRRRAVEPLFTTKGGGRGTGLGLSVSADVLRAAGGTLTIDSILGQGTTVTLRFGPRAWGAGHEGQVARA